jgi:hypothetical protein
LCIDPNCMGLDLTVERKCFFCHGDNSRKLLRERKRKVESLDASHTFHHAGLCHTLSCVLSVAVRYILIPYFNCCHY